jgi:hypothetical protein
VPYACDQTDFLGNLSAIERLYPLQFALKGDHTDFALYLLNEQKVQADQKSATQRNSIHYLVEGILQDDVRQEHRDILKLLVERGVDVNDMSIEAVTPVGKLISQIYTNTPLSLAFIKDFFRYGARITTKKAYQYADFHCNLLQVIVDSIHGQGTLFSSERVSNNVTTGMGTILKARIECAKKPYLTYLWAFKQLNAHKAQLNKIPRPLVTMIVDRAVAQEATVAEALYDIDKGLKGGVWYKKSILEQLKSLQEKFTQKNGFSHNYARLDESDQPSKARDTWEIVYQIVSPEFWNRPVRVCMQDLDALAGAK